MAAKDVNEMRRFEDYSHFAYDEEAFEADARVPYWFYAAGHTPPGSPHKPFYEWTWMNHCSRGFRYASENLSLPYTMGPDHRSYYGYELVRIAVPDQELRKKREKSFKDKIVAFLENYDEGWADAERELLGYYNELKDFDYENATWFELELVLEKLLDVDKRMWEIHMYFGCGIGAVYVFFEDLCRELINLKDTDPLFLKLMGGFENKLNEVERKLFELATKLKELGLVDLIKGGGAEEILSGLEKSEKGKVWLKDFKDFLWEDGWRTTYIFEYEPSWIEDSTPALDIIRQYISYKTFPLDEIRPKIINERKKAEEEVLSQIPVDQRDWFKTLMHCAQKYNTWNETHEYYCELYCYSITRCMLLEIGARLVKAGALDKPDDTLFLVPEEVRKALSDPHTYQLQPTVTRRHEQWLENSKKVPPPIFTRISEEEAGRLLFEGREPFITKVSIGEMPVPKPDLKADFVGLAASPGVVEGQARVILSPENLDEVEKGEILVAPSTSAPWTAIFSLLKGVVTDRGGPLSHSAIQGREYGIPVVTNIIQGTSTIKTGQRIKVDGILGVVYILDK